MHMEQVTHHHSHSHEAPKIVLSEGKRRTIRNLQFGSLAMQVAATTWEVAHNGVSALNTRILLLMAHDANDVAGWHLDLKQDEGKVSEPMRQRTEKMAHWAIATGGAYTVVEGGAAAAGVRWHEGSHNIVNTLAACGAVGVAAATTALVATAVPKAYGNMQQLWRKAGSGDKEAVKDKKRVMHGATDFLTAGAVMADTTDLLSSQSSGVLAALGGLACLYYFRPTKKNLELGHVCVAHDHGSHSHDHKEDRHEHEKHDHSHDALPQADKKQLRRRRAARLGVVAIALVAGGVVAGILGNSAPQDVIQPPSAPLIAEQTTVTVHGGDTMWGLVREQAQAVTGEMPSEKAVYELVQVAASANADVAPNPHLIHPGYTIVLPSDDVVRAKVLYG